MFINIVKSFVRIMGASVNIRRANSDDIAGIYSVMWSTGYIQFFYGCEALEVARGKLLGNLFAEDVQVYVAEIDCASCPNCKNGKKIVGYTIFAPYLQHYKTKNFPISVEHKGKIYDFRNYAYSLGTGVHVNFRRQSIGTAMRMHANNQAKKSRYGGIITDVDSTNIPSLKAQKKAGLVKVAEIPDKKRKAGINTLWIKAF